MKILGVNGSPRKNGRSAELLEIALAAARSGGAHSALVHLADYRIVRCQGCYACLEGPCRQRDDMATLLSDIEAHQAQGILYAAPVFNFNLPGLLIDFWNRKTGMLGYFRAKEEGRLNEWLIRNRLWKVGAGLVQAGHSGGERTALKHMNFALLSEAERVLPGVAGHTRRWEQASKDAANLGSQLARVLEKGRGSYPLWQMPFVYKRLTCFEFPRK